MELVKIETFENFAAHVTKETSRQISYAGSLSSGFVSLVDHTLHSGFPCQLGAVAAATPDEGHSGPVSATNQLVEMDTTVLGANRTFAVCYTEGNGTTTATWKDSGTRIQASASRIQYGPSSTSFPVRTFESTNVMAATTLQIVHGGTRMCEW
jgi:hypothetical protein